MPTLISPCGGSGGGMIAEVVYVNGVWLDPHGGGPVVLPNATVSELRWGATAFIGSLDAIDQVLVGGTSERLQAKPGGGNGANYATTWRIQINWPSFAGLRYVQLAPDNGDPAYNPGPRIAGSNTPDDDIQVLTGTFTETQDVLTNLYFYVYQASGGDVNLNDRAFGQMISVGPIL